MLIAEDLLLLLLDDEKGTTPAVWVDLRVPLGGAVLAELALDHDVELEPATSRWRTPKVAVTGETTDPVLADGLRIVAEKPRTAFDLSTRIGGGLKDRLAERLVGQGLLERHEGRVLGLFRRVTWPAGASTHEAEVLAQIRAAVVDGADPDQRTVVLIGMLHALDRLAPTLGLKGAAARDAKKRAKALAEGDWAVGAVREAVAAAISAATTATVAATTVTTTSN